MNNLSNEELVNKFNSMRGLYMLYGKFQNERDFEQAEAISKELFATIAAGEEAVKKVDGLEKEVENLQCCGNCKYFMYCKTDGLIYCEIEVFPFPIKGMCNQWQSDGLTKEERIKG